MAGLRKAGASIILDRGRVDRSFAPSHLVGSPMPDVQKGTDADLAVGHARPIAGAASAMMRRRASQFPVRVPASADRSPALYTWIDLLS